MLASAVQKNKAVQQQGPPVPLAQQILSSSPPLQIPRVPGAPHARVGTNSGHPLTIASTSQVNGVGPYTNPLKRTSSGISTGSNRTGGPRNLTAQHSKKVALSAMSARPPPLQKLHQDVYFDENDFVDDADINLDESPSESAPSKASAATVSYPSLPAVNQSYPLTQLEYPKLPESDAPLSWDSSSPTQTKPVDFNQFRRPVQPPAKQLPTAARASVEVIDLETEEMERPTKRRTLPWLTQQAESVNYGHSLGNQRVKRPKKEQPGSVMQTPAPKKTDTYMWNQTASAVKTEQRKHRLESGAHEGPKYKRSTIEEDESRPSRKAKSTKKQVAPVFLSQEQQKVLKLVIEDKKSVFFTGSAGTGKSVLMREIIAKLRQMHKGDSDRIAVTASTGLAACNIGGNTLHSFSGIGLGKEGVDQLTKRVRKNQKTVQRWQRTKVLIIDEISMIDGALFDKLEAIARNIRRKSAPFGGIQLIITGDFFQLPPVGDGGAGAKFSFDASTWNTCIDHTIGLTHVFRQRDPVFAGMLNEMRVGKLSPASIKAFQSLARPLISTNKEQAVEVEATELFPTRNEVERANGMRLQRLAGIIHSFPATDAGTLKDKIQRDKLLANCMAPQQIHLKKGAQVMLIKNIDDTLVNGSIGKVVAFMDERTFDHYDENEDEFLSTQAPEIVDAPDARKSLKGFMNSGAGNTSQNWPVVRFQIPDGTTRDLLCQPETWKIEQPDGEVLASRAQIPLILAWALSIHKAQGQTLEKVKVDLRKVFEKGQAYVALSRATTQEGLQVTGFNPSKVQAHERVRRFYDSLYGVDTILTSGLGPASKKDRIRTGIFEEDEFPFGPDEENLMAQMDM